MILWPNRTFSIIRKILFTNSKISKVFDDGIARISSSDDDPMDDTISTQINRAPYFTPPLSVSDNYEEKGKLQSWNKSSKISKDESKKRWKNGNVLKTTHESTFSLHIVAYKNPNASDSFGNENIKGLKAGKFGVIKKRCFADSLKFRNPFEFPRQQNGDQRNKPEVMEFKATQQLRGRPSSAEGKDDNDVEGGGGGEKGGGGAGENQSGQGKNGSDKKNGSDASPAGENIAAIGVGAVGTVMLKPNSDNTLEREQRKTSPPQNDTNNNGSSNNGSNNNKDIPNNANNEEQGNSGDENEEGGSDSETSDGFLKGLQSDDSFHGMLPDEDINKLLQYHGDYILHTVEKDEGKGRVIGMSILWNKEKIFVQVRAGEAGVTFDMNVYKPTILELTKYHLVEGVPVTTTKNGQGVIPRRPVLREDWELRHDDVELLEKLGEGAFGEVRLGKLKQKNKGAINVAVKVIKGTVTKKAVEEAMKEARIMRKYNHPNVVRFYGVQAEVEPLMLLMEFVKGGSLDSYLKKNRETTTVSNRASMCYDAACGLEYLHLQDCIHRDIAARNCLMDISSRKLKISDFGLSSIGAVQVLDPTKPAPIRWLSPEVIRTGCFAKPADVWSFGILCWEIYMDAEVPYKEYTMAEVQKRIGDEAFRLRLPLTCQTELRKLIGLCWIGDPNKRPTMSECVRTLKPFFDEKKKYMVDDAVRMVKKTKKHKKKKHHRTEKAEGDSKKSNIRTQQKNVSRASTVGSPNGKGSGSRKRSTKPRHEGKEADDLKNKDKHHKKQSTKTAKKGRGKTARKGESQKSDSDTDKGSNSHKSGQHQKERKRRSQPRSQPSPPPTNSKAKKSSKKGSGGKDRKKTSRNSGSDEDRKHRKPGSDEEQKSKDSTLKKKNKNRRK